MNTKKKNPYNCAGVSFSAEVEVYERAKIRMQQLGIRSFSEYVKQLIKYDLGMPNYIGSYIAQSTSDETADAVLEARATSVKSKSEQDRVA